MSNNFVERWHGVLVGNFETRKEARKLNMNELSRECECRFRTAHQQINLDVPRCDAKAEDQAALCKILQVWTLLNRGIGYYQGLNLMASALYSKLKKTSSHPTHDTLTALNIMSRVHASLVPMHCDDSSPLHNAADVTRFILREVVSADASLSPHINATFPFLQMLVLRVFPVCFASLFDTATTLYVLWNFMFEESTNSSQTFITQRANRRSRHIISALLLNQAKLWKLNSDQKQNFKIFEAVLSLLPEKEAKRIVRSARHLEKLERLGGTAM